MHELAIRFCGGCRATHDQVGWLQRLLANLQAKGYQVNPVYDLDQYPEVGLIICGCETQCLAQTADLPEQWHSVGPNSIFDNSYLSFDSLLQVIMNELQCTDRK